MKIQLRVETNFEFGVIDVEIAKRREGMEWRFRMTTN